MNLPCMIRVYSGLITPGLVTPTPARIEAVAAQV
jgi:hypothetical protein